MAPLPLGSSPVYLWVTEQQAVPTQNTENTTNDRASKQLPQALLSDTVLAMHQQPLFAQTQKLNGDVGRVAPLSREAKEREKCLKR